jgi:hypothetical protein
MTERPQVAHQYALTVDKDGDLEPATASTPTDLGDFFAVWNAADPRDYDGPRIERPAASTFGIDDRVEGRHSPAGGDSEQVRLFHATDDAQRTLDSGAASCAHSSTEVQRPLRTIHGGGDGQ